MRKPDIARDTAKRKTRRHSNGAVRTTVHLNKTEVASLRKFLRHKCDAVGLSIEVDLSSGIGAATLIKCWCGKFQNITDYDCW